MMYFEYTFKYSKNIMILSGKILFYNKQANLFIGGGNVYHPRYIYDIQVDVCTLTAE